MTGETASIEQFRLGQLEPPHIHVRGNGARAKLRINPIALAENIGVALHELNCDTTMLWVSLADGRQLGVLLAYFPRLLKATVEQRQHYEFSGAGTGIHWDELDEDISVQGLLMGLGDRTRTRQLAA